MEYSNSSEEKKIANTIIYARRKAILEKFDELEKKMIPIKTLRRRQRIRNVSLICLAVLVAIGVWRFSIPNFSGEEAFLSVYERYPSTGVKKSNTEDKIKILEQKAYMNYDSGNLAPAIKQMQGLFDLTGEDRFLFYQGVALLEKGKIKKAIKTLKTYKTKTQALNLQADYFIGLAYVRIGDIEQARVVFRNLPADNKYHKYLEQAIKKLEDL